MKKYVKNYLVLMLMLVIPFSVYAVSGNVKTLDASKSGSTISFEGTTDDGLTAVTCILKEAEAGDIDIVHVSVDSNNFSGSFSGVGDGSYKVSCANYDSGTPVEVDVDDKVVIKNMKITVTPPKPGDKVNLVDVQEEEFSYKEPDKLPEVKTSDSGYEIESAHYVKGTCSGESSDCEKLFEGTFEDGKDYYVMIYVNSKAGYKFTLNSLNNIKINGAAPVEVFNVYSDITGTTRTMFIAKVKATSKVTSTEETKTSNVKTGDNIMNYVGLLFISVSLLLVFKKFNIIKNK